MEDTVPIEGHPHYRITRDGRVWSAYINTWLKPGIFTGGYPGVVLYENGKRRSHPVHRLVAEAFIGPRPEGMEIRHLDGDPSNNRVENLAYGTHAENMQDKVRHGTHHLAAKTHCPAGHPYSGDNLIIEGGGGRRCRECKNARKRTPEALALARKAAKIRRQAKPKKPKKPLATHCYRGHAYDDANTRITKTGGRVCRACHRDRERTRTTRTEQA